jgi:hypothetical protein
MEADKVTRYDEGIGIGSGDIYAEPGMFGTPVDQLPVGPDGIHICSHGRRLLTGPSPEEQTRKEMYVRMAANMIISEEPRGNYFVREPGL